MEYFVYRHVRLDDNSVFYIGIGTKIKNYNSFKSEYRRAFNKRRNKHWINIVNKTKYEVEILYESNDYEIIKGKEIEFIKLYGRKDLGCGTLVNYTNGGDGTIGYKFTEEQIKKLSDSHKGQEPYMKGKKHKVNSRLKMSFARLGKYKGENSPSFGKQVSLLSKIKMSTPVLQYDLNDNLIGEFYSLTEAAIQTKSDFRLIQKVCKGERNKHNNFIWKYKDINNTRI